MYKKILFIFAQSLIWLNILSFITYLVYPTPKNIYKDVPTWLNGLSVYHKNIQNVFYFYFLICLIITIIIFIKRKKGLLKWFFFISRCFDYCIWIFFYTWIHLVFLHQHQQDIQINYNFRFFNYG